jgi:hypothetical protein
MAAACPGDLSRDAAETGTISHLDKSNMICVNYNKIHVRYAVELSVLVCGKPFRGTAIKAQPS